MGAIGIADSDLYEGDEASRRAARERRLRDQRVIAARANRSWLELRPDRIERHGRYIVDVHDGALFEPLRPGVDVWAGGDPGQPLNVDVPDAFVVVDGDVVFLRRSRDPETIDDLRWLEADREEQAEKAREKADSDADHHERALQAYRRDQPLRAATLGDMLGKDLPTIRGAVQMVFDCGGRVDAGRDGVSVQLPERLSPDDAEDRRIHDDLMGAATVILSAAATIQSAAAGKSTHDMIDRLPDVYVDISGWPVS
jgi:hypothetical protein